MTVNSKLTHYKIRQISTEKNKTDKLLKRCSSAGRQFHGLTTLSVKKTFAHINTALATARQEFVSMAPGVMVTVSKCASIRFFISPYRCVWFNFSRNVMGYRLRPKVWIQSVNPLYALISPTDTHTASPNLVTVSGKMLREKTVKNV